jgi:hypothetical protein
MPGLIERIIEQGSERPELVNGIQGAEVGGQRITFSPKDLASVITVLRPREIKTMLAIEGESLGSANFIAKELGVKAIVVVNDKVERELKKTLRNIPHKFDLITIDSRNLPLDADEIWQFIKGGKEEQTPKFGGGAAKDYGTPKIKDGSCVIVNRHGQDSAAFWFRLRARHAQIFQSLNVGVVHV